MGIQERRERERQDLRTKILDAARELFAERGYESVTMRELAKKIEYSPTVLYGHFADKDTLLRELCQLDFSNFAERFVELLKVEDPLERLCRAGFVYFEFAVAHPQQYRLMFMTPHPIVPPEAGERDSPSRNAYVFLRASVAEAIALGRARPELKDPDLVAQTIWGAVHGLASLEITLASDDSWVDFKDRSERARGMIEFICDGFARDSAAVRRKLASMLEGYEERPRRLPRAPEPAARPRARATPTGRPRRTRRSNPG
jgi:AcrR family transcriptional regulator